FVCTFPGHWIIMKGDMIVAKTSEDAQKLVAANLPQVVSQWKLKDFSNLQALQTDDTSVMRGMQAFVKARCNQCHVVSGHGINLGPDLTHISKRFQGQKLLQQILDPSIEINKDYQTIKFLLGNGKLVSGVVVKETKKDYQVIQNLITPKNITKVRKSDIEEKAIGKISSMPEGLLNVLTRQEVLNLLAFLQVGGHQLPDHLKHGHGSKN
ncbi:MAG: c-type cytochrome, partial [Planctomycetota bacterium]|nr:c-type cytochrome [Planctomycetota bacterium]